MDLASRPQYMQELYEEQLRMYRNKYRLVNIYLDETYQDGLLQETNPKKFEPFRHVDANAPASKIGKNFMPFGGGKHASGKMEERKSPTAIPSSSRIILKRGLSEI
ncbi:hypothetical protein RhiirA4_466689 [Rhizophagus irregularis]|uniref:Uncharacterized protein n=1 Tax=Rhizophagus irregularis TaxID=588596 RepID=A0A2I1GUK2_9GLOM|nr:hypothetical protein RhiirA4_466689 [Rhizophagus irregularis]